MIELSILADLCSEVVNALIFAPLLVLRSVSVVDGHDFESLTAVTVLINCSITVNYELDLRRKDRA